MIASLSSSITHQIASHGAYAVFALMALDAFLPMGSEVVMVFAGAIAAGVGALPLHMLGVTVRPGLASYLLLSMSGTLGYLLGGCLGWLIGVRGGRRLIHSHGSWLHLNPGRIGRTERWFNRWGRLSVALSRVVPVVRSFVSIPAGAFEVPFIPYVALTLIGSAVWCFALAGVGWALGASYGHFDSLFTYAEYSIVGLVLIGAAAPLIAHLRSTHGGGSERLDG